MDHTDGKSCLAMWNGDYGASRNPGNYDREDDGSHIHPHEKEYFEWWYLDAAFENGYHAVITFHYRNMFLNPIIPSIQIYFYTPEGEKIARFKAVAPEDAKVNPNYCNVEMDDSWLRDHGDHYEVYMKIDGVGARLKFRNKAPSWKPGTGFSYKNEKSGLVSGWVVPVPNASVEGEIYLDGETMAVKGSGYHDHNWGNCYCYRLFKSWYWGRAHSPRHSIIYAQILPVVQGLPAVCPLLIAKEDEIILSTNRLNVQLFDDVVDEEFGRMYKKNILLDVDTNGVKFHMEINTRRIMEAMRLPRITDVDHFYYRFLADYNMEIVVDGIAEQTEGELLQELMIF